jgi:phage protein D
MTPGWRIDMNGKPSSNEFERRLISVTVNDEAGIVSDSVEIELDAVGDIDPPPVGSEIQVWLGYEPQPKYMGRFKISSWSLAGPLAVIRVVARAAELTADIKAQKDRDFHEMTLGEIVQKIAGEHGLGVAMDAALAARPIEHIDQQDESDMAFLTRLAKRNGATFKVGDGKIIFTAKGSRTLPDGTPKPRIAVKASDISSWEAHAEERGSFRSVKATYYDQDKGKRIAVTAGSGAPALRIRGSYATEAEAKAAAEARLGDLTRGRLTVEFSGPGNPDIFAEGLVGLAGFPAGLDGDYLAKSVRHEYSSNGFTTEADLESFS